jgi:REP element-mobilizing transposase RayT
MNTNAVFGFGEFYHVYNRTNNKEKLFKTEKNRRYFLFLLKAKLNLIADVYAYALLDNHFHLLIQVKSEEEIQHNLSRIEKCKRSITVNRYLDSIDKDIEIHKLISVFFSGAFNSYTQAINKCYGRHGNLFSRPFKRSQVYSEAKLEYLFNYIHKNSMKHGKTTSYLYDKWNSYRSILLENNEIVNTKLVLDFFGGKSEFVKFHQEYENLVSDSGKLVVI